MEENKDFGVIYSKEIQSAIERIGLLSAETQPPSYFSLYNDIIPGLYNHLLDYEISLSTFKLVWQMLNRVVAAGNFVWFKQYWSWAVQYAMFRFQGERKTAGYRRFYFFHVMTGALLCFNKRYDWLTYTLFYTTQLPERFGLVPNTYQEIMDEAETIYYRMEQPFYFESNFNFSGLASGARNDSIIVGAAYEYLALLMIRLWSLDYNVSFVDPKTLPILDAVNMDRNEGLGKAAGMIKTKVRSWYAKDRINEIELRVMPLEEDVTRLLDDFTNEILRQNNDIFEHSEPDIFKVERLKTDLQESAKRFSKYFPTNTNSELNEKNAEFKDYSLEYKYKVDKSLLIAGRSISYTNLPDFLIRMLVKQAISYYEKLFIDTPGHLLYKIRYDDIGIAIKKLSLSDDFVILSFGEYIDGRFGIGNPVVNVESRLSCIIILRKNVLPYTEYVTKTMGETDMEDILPNGSHLYSNVKHIKKDGILKLVQHIRIYASKEPMKFIRLQVDHFSLLERFDLDNIKEVDF